MSSRDFYSCTWYDWSLWTHKINRDQQKRTEDQELIIEMFRSSLCYYYNWNRGENNTVIDRQEFWKLSYDGPRENNTEPTEEEKAKIIATIKRLESKRKKSG
jgi:hypothetical protein